MTLTSENVVKILIQTVSCALSLVVALNFCACSKSVSGPLSSFSSEFKSASPDLKAKADLCVSAMKTNGYFLTIMTLREMRSTPAPLPPKQDAAIADLLEVAMGELTLLAEKGNPEAIEARKVLSQMRRR